MNTFFQNLFKLKPNKSWRKFVASHPVKWSLSALYWIPSGIVFTKYFYTVKLVTGTSMQVRQRDLTTSLLLEDAI